MTACTNPITPTGPSLRPHSHPAGAMACLSTPANHRPYWLHAHDEAMDASPSPSPNAPRRPLPSAEERDRLPPFPVLSEVRIHVPGNLASLQHARQHLLHASVLGFDTESQPWLPAGDINAGPHLLQLATPTDAWLLHLDQSAPLQLAREVMRNPRILKVGFGLAHDLQTLPPRLNVPIHGVQDLDDIFWQHGFGKNLGVRNACAVVLQQSFHKLKKVSVSNWAARPLNPAQRRYAANDAHAPAVIWEALPQWQAQHPLP